MKRVRMDSNRPDRELVGQAVAILRAGGVVIYPSDTCYGIGAEASNASARQRILEIKQRTDIGLSVIIPGLETIAHWAIVHGSDRAILQKYLPGPFTFLLANMGRSLVNLPRIGIRYPDNLLLQTIARQLGRPYSTTSANLSGQPPIYSLAELDKFLENLPGAVRPDLVIDGGDLPRVPPSTLVDLTSHPPQIIRQGTGIFNG